MSLNDRRLHWVLKQVARECMVDQTKLLTVARWQPLAEARQIAMCVLRVRWRLSLPVIGALFDRDHTTVLHAVQVMRAHPLVDRISAYADAAGLDDVLPAPTNRVSTGFPQVANRPEYSHFSMRFVGLR